MHNITCPNCKNENPMGTVFCNNCGLALIQVAIGTRQLGDTGNLSAGSEKLDHEHVVIIHVDGEAEPLTIQLIDKAILGRTGGETAEVALINLDPYRAETQGVSRRHALLQREADRVYISDLGSTNHSYLNSQQLQEHDRLVIRDGDQVRLGHLGMRIFFK